ncbi:MAG: hypothetical protein DMG30_00465 [Acidobacteria bacterium]|nr:MAG: hypothetical protein DMG30_00465 [Acidobacteriota bacterium]
MGTLRDFLYFSRKRALCYAPWIVTSADILNICHNYHLSRREGETVRFLIEGLTNKEIAARMGISPDTVKVFLRLAMMKMGVSSRTGIMSKFIHLKESDSGLGTETSRTVHRPIHKLE